MENVAPAVGQVWRGNNPQYGFGQFGEALIIEITDRSIILRWLDGSGTHQSESAHFWLRQTWSFVRATP